MGAGERLPGRTDQSLPRAPARIRQGEAKHGAPHGTTHADGNAWIGEKPSNRRALAADVIGVAVIISGLAAAFGLFARDTIRRRVFPDAYRALRHSLGRSILFGLEILVAADIIRTVAVEPTLQSVTVLGGIVAIRTFLSFSLEVELEGRWPWQQSDTSRRGRL